MIIAIVIIITQGGYANGGNDDDDDSDYDGEEEGGREEEEEEEEISSSVGGPRRNFPRFQVRWGVPARNFRLENAKGWGWKLQSKFPSRWKLRDASCIEFSRWKLRKKTARCILQNFSGNLEIG